jgi:hypothetical protein
MIKTLLCGWHSFENEKKRKKTKKNNNRRESKDFFPSGEPMVGVQHDKATATPYSFRKDITKLL